MSPHKTIFRFFLTYLCVLLPMLALNFSAQRVVLVQAQHRTDEGVVWQLQQVALELESLKERCEDYTVRLGTSDIMRARRVLDGVEKPLRYSGKPVFEGFACFE